MTAKQLRNKLSKKTPLLVSPFGFALAACGGGGGGGGSAIVTTGIDELVGWEHPTALSDINLLNTVYSRTDGLSLVGGNVENSTIELSPELIEVMTPEGGSVVITWFQGAEAKVVSNDFEYIVLQDDVDKSISIEALFYDTSGKLHSVAAQTIQPILNVNDAPTGQVSDVIVSTTIPFKTISPVVSDVVGETNWGGTWYTGDSSFAVDGNSVTKWTYEGLGMITFDLGKNFNIDAINISFNGSVSNGNYVNIYVDDVVVASGIQPAYTKTWDIEDTVGRYVSYETVSEPHNEYLQVATWSEISEITVLAQELVV